MPNDEMRLGDRLLAAWAHPAGSRRAPVRSRAAGPPSPRADAEEADGPAAASG